MSRKQQYTHTRATLTPTPPPPKTWTAPTYHLESYTIRRHVRTVNVQLHGLRGHEKRTESISFPLVPTITDAELVRAAVFCSPNKWTVPFGMNVKQFNGKFTAPLDGHVFLALIRAPQSAPPGAYQQTEFPAYAAPTVANAPVSQPHSQPPIPQPGQFYQGVPPYQPVPRGSRGNLWQWYKGRSGRVKVGLGCGLIIAVLLFFSCIGSVIGSSNFASTSPTPTPTTERAAVLNNPVVTDTPTPTPVPTEKPTSTPMPKPTLAPTHAPQPTRVPPTPKPPACQGVSGNPWCYNFVPGNLIYYPPAGFCNYFACIPSFVELDDPGDGYIVECNDGTYSQSGGERGACSYHDGVMRPLYSH